MNKQILLIIACFIGLQAPVLAMQTSLVDAAFASKPAGVRRKAAVQPAAAAQQEPKSAVEADEIEFEHIRIRRNSLDNGQFEEEHRTRTNKIDAQANDKIDKAIKAKQAYRDGLVKKIAREKDTLWKSAGALALTVFVSMHMHKHNHIERIAEYYGPMTAHAIQVIATLALGTSAKTMWDAGMSAYSKWPNAISQVDIEIEKEQAKKVSPVRVKEKVRIKNFGERPWPKRTRVEREPDVAPAQQAPAAAADGIGLGLSASSVPVPKPAESRDVVGLQPEPVMEPVVEHWDANGKIIEE